jgi:hypothetical protein
MAPEHDGASLGGRLVQLQLRWTPVAAALVAVTLVTVNSFRTARHRAGQITAEYNPPADATESAHRRTAWKVEVVADLVAGRITTGEAHDRFLDANRADPKSLEYLRAVPPGETDEERTACQLVLFVRAFPHPRAGEVAAAVGRELLGRELPPGRPAATDWKRVPVPQ